MKSKSFRCVAVVVGLALCATGRESAIAVESSAPPDHGETVRAEQWRVRDLDFSVPDPPAHPFDVDFQADFRGPDGTQLRVPGFYNGNRQYVIRFSAPSPGVWTYATVSTLKALSSRHGRVEAAPAGPGRHGPVQIDRSAPQRFVYADGTRYFPLAFEADWLFALDATNPAAIPKTTSLVNYVTRYGFNQVVMNVFAYDISWKTDARPAPEFDFGRPALFPFGGSNDQPEHSTLNVDFFKRLDRVIACLDDRGAVAHLMIYVWNKKVSWPPAGSADDNRYFDYVVKRYQAYPNLIWDISKEALGYGHNDKDYITGRIERLRRLDAFGHLVTVHDYTYCDEFPDRVDFISIQTWATDLYRTMREVREKHPRQPVFNIEDGSYEAGPYRVFAGDYDRPEVCLERAYQTVFAGSYPTHYWQCAAWSVVIPDPSSLSAALQPRLAYYRHLADLVAKYRIAELRPATGLCSSGYCLADDSEKLFLCLVPGANSAISVTLPAGKGTRLQATWFDPFTGEFHPEGTTAYQRWKTYDTRNDGRMAVLIVELLP
jgi:hypothetical protein